MRLSTAASGEPKRNGCWMLSFRESNRKQNRDAQRAPRERRRRAIEIRGRLVRVSHLPANLSAYHDPSLQALITPKARWLCRVTPINDNHVFGHHLATTPPWASLASRVMFSLSVPSIFIRGAASPLLADPTTSIAADRERYRLSIIQQRSLAACGFWFGFESCRANYSNSGV
jgi:hypothetical protein